MNTSFKDLRAPDSNAAMQRAPARTRRFASMMYEGVLLFAVVFIAGYAFDTLTQSRHALMLRHARQFWLFIAIGLYFVACWGRSGQTLPMKAWHIRLVNKNQSRPSLRQLLFRYALMWLLPLAGAAVVWAFASLSHWPSALMFIVATPFCIFIPTWFTPGQQFLHDCLAGTQLVNTCDSTPPRKHP
jgi:uncharacterized RDD family membrane protein YckC